MRLLLPLAPMVSLVVACAAPLDVNDHEGMWREVEVKQKALVVPSPASRARWNPPRLHGPPKAPESPTATLVSPSL